MPIPQTLWSVSFTATPEWAEKLSAALEDNALALSIMAPPRKNEAHVEALYNDEPDPAALNGRMAIMAMLHKIKPPKLIIKQTPKLDWLKKVAADFPPLQIARWTVHGAHHRNKVPNRRNALQIDATSAFGTGEHPTTRGCLLMLDKMLEKYPRAARQARALDMGCGSGILGMAWAQTLHRSVVAVDLDPDSVLIAEGNAKSNGLAKFMRIGKSRGYTGALVKRNAPYDLIMANIFAGPLSHMAKDLKNNLRPGGKVILAGLLSHQANKVLAAHRMQKIYLAKRLKIGEWTILALRYPSKAQ